MIAHFYLDASPSLGNGHYNRCVSLARELQKSNVGVRFFVGSENKDVCELTEKTDIDCCAVEVGVWNNAVSSGAEIAIFDVSHNYTKINLPEFRTWIENARYCYKSMVLLDSTGEQSIRNNFPDFFWDLIVAPYPGESSSNSKQGKILGGTDYFILSPNYISAINTEKHIRNEVDNILVTSGGGDNIGFTRYVLKSILELDLPHITVNCIIGPFFSKEYIEELIVLSQETNCKIQFLEGLSSLANQMYSADIAIALTGLSRYELAAVGVPAILLSIDDAHSRMHHAFDEMSLYEHLGVLNRVSSFKLQEAIRELCRNYATRKAMSERARLLVDGHGATRIVRHLMKLNY